MSIAVIGFCCAKAPWVNARAGTAAMPATSVRRSMPNDVVFRSIAPPNPETEFNWAVGRLRRKRKLPQRDHQPVEIGGDDHSDLAARQRQHCAVLVSQYDPAHAWADRNARAGSAVYAIHVGRASDVADLT